MEVPQSPVAKQMAEDIEMKSPVMLAQDEPSAVDIVDINIEDRVDDLDGHFVSACVNVRYNKERFAWYSFDWANSVFATLAIAMIIPVFLAGLAESYAYHGHTALPCSVPYYGSTYNSSVLCRDPLDISLCSYNGECQCRVDADGSGVWSLSQPLFFGTCHQCMLGAGPVEWYGPTLMKGEVPWQRSQDKATVSFMGFEVTPFSYTSLILSISVILQALVFIAVGPFADYGNYRKRMLIFFSSLGALTCGAFFFTGHPADYGTAGVLSIIANVCFGASIVFYNAYLPLLADSHQDVQNTPEGTEKEETRDRVINNMSMKGFGSGYVAGFLIVCIAFPFVWNLENSPESGRLADRTCMLLVCLWWGSFSLIALKWLKARPGPPLPVESNCEKLTLGFRRIANVLKECRKHPNTFRFLVAFFFYSDGVSSVPAIGILFGQMYMCMDTYELLGVLIINVAFSAIGCALFQGIQNKTKWNAKSMLLLVLCCQIGMITYMASGILQTNFGLWHKWEIYLFGVLYGLLNGAWQSYSRVMWADMTIPGHEAEFFALFEITDRGSSWLTPFIVSIIESTTGELRLAFLWILVITIIPAICIKFGVDYEQGKIDVGRCSGVKGAVKEGKEAKAAAAKSPYRQQKDSNSHEHLEEIKALEVPTVVS